MSYSRPTELIPASNRLPLRECGVEGYKNMFFSNHLGSMEFLTEHLENKLDMASK